MNRVPRLITALLLLGLGLWLWPRAPRSLRFPPSSQDLLRLSGPLRVLPVPFAWQAFGSAVRKQDEALVLARGRWLLGLMPEAEGLYAGLAWQLAYNLGSLEGEALGRARRVREALILLEEGMRERPELVELPALAGYILENQAQMTGMQPALEQVLGEDPAIRASRYLERAARIGPLDGGRRFLLLSLALRLLELGERPFAAQILETLAGQEPGMSPRLRELARALRARGPLSLSPELCRWVLETEPFSRKPGLWPCR